MPKGVRGKMTIPIQKDEYRHRQARLAETLRVKQWDAFLVTQNVDIYYLTGTMQSGYLWIPADGEPVFYVKRSVVRAVEEAACRVEELGSFRSFGERLVKGHPKALAKEGPHIATEFDVLPVQLYQRLQSILPSVQWVDGSTLLRELRMIKSDAELSLIRECARVIDIALEEALAQLRVGVSDLELITWIEQSIRRQGHAGLMRMRGYNQEIITGMVASGRDAAVPTYFDGPAGGRGLYAASPQGAGRKVIERDEPILIDIGCCIDGYVIDQTRTAVIGTLDAQLTQAYTTAERILRAVEMLLKPGTICEELYLQSVAIAADAGLAEHYMGYGADQVKFLGHGIGLEIDELPVLARGFRYALQPGMVLAIEPKFTFPDMGVVGIENSYVITEDGYERLTCSREGVLVAGSARKA